MDGKMTGTEEQFLPQYHFLPGIVLKLTMSHHRYPHLSDLL